MLVSIHHGHVHAPLLWTLWLQFSTGCLFHGRQFESQQELRIENGTLTWQVTSNSGLTQRGIVEIKLNAGMSTDLLCDRGMCGISVLPR